MYDYYLGGKDNFAVDRQAVQEMLETIPELFQTARENRSFLGRAVRLLAESGIRQFIDIGTGLPTQGNVHEIARRAQPEARIVYVDHDPVVLAHARAILARDTGVEVVHADAREPETILNSPEVEKLIDFSQPVGVLFVAILHFLPDEDRPEKIVGRFRDAMAPGSHLVIAHGTRSAGDSAAAKLTDTYRRATANVHLRHPQQIDAFFEGLELLPPGACFLPWWRPDPGTDLTSATQWHYGGVGRKPSPA